MRKQLSILAASALAIGGIGIISARADDPASPPANQQPADRMDSAGGDLARPQSPAAKHVRDTIAEATSAAVQGKFSDFKERFSSEDRKRLGDGFKDNQTLKDRWTQFSQDWKAKYNEDFDSSHIKRALDDASVRIIQGDYTDRARTASERITPDRDNTNVNTDTDKHVNKPGEKTDENKAGENNSGAFSRDNQPKGNADTTATDRTTTGDHATMSGDRMAGDKDWATIWFTSTGTGTPGAAAFGPSRVALHNEGGIGNTWKIDLPNNFDAQSLSDSLQQHVLMVEDQKGSWPADVNDAYRTVSNHVLMALSSPGMSATPGAPAPGQPADPTNPNPTPNR